jgi:hypothetical protein
MKYLTLFTVLMSVFIFSTNVYAGNCAATATWTAPQYLTDGNCNEDPNKPLTAEQLSELIYVIRLKTPADSNWTTEETTQDTFYPIVGECGTSIVVQGCSKFPETDSASMCCTTEVTKTLARPAPGCMKNFEVRDK